MEQRPHEVKYVTMMGSAAHTYGNALATVQNWVMNLFPEKTFKTIHVNSRITHRQMLSTPHEFLKKSKPMIIFRPRISYDEDRFLNHTLLTERQGDIYNAGAYTDLQPFFQDNQSKIACKYTLNRYVMYVDVVMIFNTLIQQINYIHFLKNATRIGIPFDIETFLESYISSDMMKMISKLSGVPIVSEDGNTKDFLDYMNTNSEYPVTYKLQGSSGTDEYYRYYPAKILTTISDISADDGERVGQITNAYQCSFTMKLEFFGTGFYYLFSDKIHDLPKFKIPDDSTLIPIFTDVLLEEDLCLAPGWKIYNHFSCQLDKEYDSVDFEGTLNTSIREAVQFHLKTGRPLVDLIDVKVRRQGNLLQNMKDYMIDWEHFKINFNNKSYGFFTYKVIVSINVLYINELIKEIYKLK